MSVLPKVLGMTVAGVLVIAFYLACSVGGALVGGVAAPSAANPLSFMIYVGLALTATFLAAIMYLTTIGGEEEE